jgi:hypothetical protein
MQPIPNHAPEPRPRPRLVAVETPQPQREQVVVSVDFRGPKGQRWNAIGGGATLLEALTYARAAAPEGVAWVAVRWTDVYGD